MQLGLCNAHCFVSMCGVSQKNLVGKNGSLTGCFAVLRHGIYSLRHDYIRAVLESYSVVALNYPGSSFQLFTTLDEI